MSEETIVVLEQGEAAWQRGLHPGNMFGFFFSINSTNLNSVLEEFGLHILYTFELVRLVWHSVSNLKRQKQNVYREDVKEDHDDVDSINNTVAIRLGQRNESSSFRPVNCRELRIALIQSQQMYLIFICTKHHNGI
jgi:hypothetical protein